MILVDTSVLLYAVGTEHELRDPSRRLVAAIAARDLEAGTTVEVIQEFAHVRARRRTRADAATYAGEYLDLLSPLIDVTERTLQLGLRLFVDHDRLDAFDSILAAVAATPSVTALVSADRAYASVPGLRHVFPDATGVESLLA